MLAVQMPSLPALFLLHNQVECLLVSPRCNHLVYQLVNLLLNRLANRPDSHLDSRLDNLPLDRLVNLVGSRVAILVVNLLDNRPGSHLDNLRLDRLDCQPVNLHANL